VTEGTSPDYFAHSLASRPESEWELLADHLSQVAELAAELAAAFQAREWGRLAGLWHDLGKYRPEFQARLRGSGESVEHAGAGAALAFSKDRVRGLPLAFVIAGHHAGLANLSAAEPGGRTPLQIRLKKNSPLLEALSPRVPPDFTEPSLPDLPVQLTRTTPDRSNLRSLEMWTRFLFSALVDADSLATEDFYFPGHRAAALAGRDDIPTLRQRLDASLDALVAEIPQEKKSSQVNRLRAEILAACRAKAELPPGLFSLTVPTGGGKTLAAMSFALRHAEQYGLRRVIAAIPFTSIIEQNAAAYRKALGAANVIEHHSGLDPLREEDIDREAETRRRLAAENWDAPVIVTTNVQLFESLFAASRSRCRKLHSLARSVILLDEAQTLPSEYLLAVLDSLRELTTHFGCTVVLTTATQPALARRESLPQGLEGVREIIPDPNALARDLQRVHVRWPQVDEPPLPYERLAEELLTHPRVLVVVHRRVDARQLAKLLSGEPCFHLSALMCPAHRSAVLAQVKARLGTDLPCRLVSTQLIEAGVDVDFPVVYRALGGLDSLAQAAGRCNREGRLSREEGRVVFFRAETLPPPGTPRKGLAVVDSMLREGGIRLEDLASFEIYFRRLYLACDLDSKGIQPLRQTLSFESVAARMKLIEDGSVPLVVPYGAALERLEEVRRQGPSRLLLRSLQPFVINLFDRDVSRLYNAGAVEEIGDGIRTLSWAFHPLYDPAFGLTLEDEIRPDPARMVA
jgi:CRISPR-associated endonuclease/helicase Cas3